MDSDIVIIGAKRSIIGSESGSLKSLTAVDLAVSVINFMLREIETNCDLFSRSEIHSFISGICIGSNIGQNLPRQIMEKCRIEKIETAFTVNEMCGSSLEAVIQAMNSIRLNEYPIALAGGVEMPSASPFYLTKDQLLLWKDKKVGEIEELVLRGDIRDALWCSMHDVHTIVHAENTTEKWVNRKGYNREEFKKKIDEYAVLSSERALASMDKGYPSREIAPVQGQGERDEIPKIKKISRLSRLRGTHFTPDGLFLTSHNSPPLANGAAYLLLMNRETAQKKKLKALASITAYSRAGVNPEEFLLAPVKAVKQLLEKTSTSIEDYDLFEMNTSYGSQMLINREELGLDMDKVNIYGDCIALGHPVGAAGARILTTLVHGLNRTGGKNGLVSICLGGGNGLALSIRREE